MKRANYIFGLEFWLYDEGIQAHVSFRHMIWALYTAAVREHFSLKTKMTINTLQIGTRRYYTEQKFITGASACAHTGRRIENVMLTRRFLKRCDLREKYYSALKVASASFPMASSLVHRWPPARHSAGAPESAEVAASYRKSVTAATLTLQLRNVTTWCLWLKYFNTVFFSVKEQKNQYWQSQDERYRFFFKQIEPWSALTR